MVIKGENSSIVKLNVGGSPFYVYRETLALSKYFQNLLEGDMNNFLITDKDEIFIDRDAGLFEYILIYLRTGRVSLKDKDELKELQSEAEYYQIEDMVQVIGVMLNDNSTQDKTVFLMDPSELLKIGTPVPGKTAKQVIFESESELYYVWQSVELMGIRTICAVGCSDIRCTHYKQSYQMPLTKFLVEKVFKEPID